MSNTSESILNNIDLEQADAITVRPNIDDLIMQMHYDDWLNLANHAENREHGVLRVLRRAHELDVLPNMDDDALRIAYLSILLRSVPHRKERSLRVFSNGIQHKLPIDDAYFDEWSSWSEDHGWAITTLNRSPEDYLRATEHFELISKKRQTWDFLLFEGVTNRSDLIDIKPFFTGLNWLNGFVGGRTGYDDKEVTKNSRPWITKGLSHFRRGYSNKVLFAHRLISRLNFFIIYPSIRDEKDDLHWDDHLRQEQVLLFLTMRTHRAPMHPGICDEMDHDPVLAKIKADIKSKSGSSYHVLRVLCELRGLNPDDFWTEIKKRKVPVEMFPPILQGLIDHARMALNPDLRNDTELEL